MTLVTVRRGCKLGGPNYTSETCEFEDSEELPPNMSKGELRQRLLFELEAEITSWKLEHTPKNSITKPTEHPFTSPAVVPLQSTGAILEDDLANLPWEPNSKGEGEHVKLKDVPDKILSEIEFRLRASKGKWVAVGGFSYPPIDPKYGTLGRFPTKPFGGSKH